MFRHLFSSRYTALLSLIGLTLALLVAPLYSRTQQPPQPPPADPAQNMKEAQELLQAVEDIGMMKVINPLRLTPAQLDKLITVITSAQAEYNSQISVLDQAALKKIADDIRSVRRQSIAGKTVSTDATDRINKTIDAHLKNTKTRQDDALKNMSQKVRDILLNEQFSTASKLAKQETEKFNQNAKGTEEQWFNLYVKNVIMSYPRIVPLLKDIRAVREEGKSASTDPEKGGANPAP